MKHNTIKAHRTTPLLLIQWNMQQTVNYCNATVVTDVMQKTEKKQQNAHKNLSAKTSSKTCTTSHKQMVNNGTV